MCDEPQPRIGNVLPGQLWIELHGAFTREELMSLVAQINSTNKGLVDGDTKLRDGVVGTESEDHMD